MNHQGQTCETEKMDGKDPSCHLYSMPRRHWAEGDILDTPLQSFQEGRSLNIHDNTEGLCDVSALPKKISNDGEFRERKRVVTEFLQCGECLPLFLELALRLVVEL